MSLESRFNPVCAWKIAGWAALVAFVVMFLPPTLRVMHLRQLVADFEAKRPAYERAAQWALTQNGKLPADLAAAVGQDDPYVDGKPGQRVVYFELEDLGETVRKIAFVEVTNVDVEKLETGWMAWTERRIDDHWQLVQVLP